MIGNDSSVKCDLPGSQRPLDRELDTEKALRGRAPCVSTSDRSLTLGSAVPRQPVVLSRLCCARGAVFGPLLAAGTGHLSGEQAAKQARPTVWGSDDVQPRRWGRLLCRGLDGTRSDDGRQSVISALSGVSIGWTSKSWHIYDGN